MSELNVIVQEGLNSEKLEMLLNTNFETHYIKSLTRDEKGWIVCLLRIKSTLPKTKRETTENEKPSDPDDDSFNRSPLFG